MGPILRALLLVGPGIAVAATGVGAGDIIAVTVAGSRYGLVVAWTALVGALLKFILAEGVARWQLATGTTLLEGWITRLGRPVAYYFFAYLVVWSFVVGGALIGACGLAAHALAPFLSYRVWGVLHSAAAVLFVLLGRYGAFERAMKLFVGIMFGAVVAAASTADVDGAALAFGVALPRVPAGSLTSLLAVIGGVGGTVTLLSYSYWLREKGWEGRERMGIARIDLAVAYGLTGLFGVAVIALASATLFEAGVVVEGREAALRMSEMLEGRGGRIGAKVFLVGFWGAVASSLVGVWQSVPYLFADGLRLLRGEGERDDLDRTPAYRLYLLFLAAPPIALLWLSRPVWLVLVYAALGSLFMPFLAGTLFFLLNRGRWIGPLRNGRLANGGLLLSLLLFLYLAVAGLLERFGS